MTDPVLFDVELADQEDAGLTVPLAQRYGFAPFSVINRREGQWQERKRKWNKLGLDSGAGRPKGLLLSEESLAQLGRPGQYASLNSTSVFDPALCELAYDWFSAPGHHVLDPFAGGSVRGLVASRLGRDYTGIDLSASQIAANQAQAHLADPEHLPTWINGDSSEVLLRAEFAGSEPGYDFVFSCPPYFDLEQYSDGPRDLSGMTWDEFSGVYCAIIYEAIHCLRPNRFAAWVISDIRDTKGKYRGLVRLTEEAFEDAGASLYNELIITDPVGSVAVRAARPFDSSRKVARLHQYLLVFVKGDPKVAAKECNARIEAADVPVGNGESTLF